MTVITTQVEVRKMKRNEFLKIMQEVAKKTKQETDCERFEIHQHLDDENIFSFTSVWKNPSGFRKHLKSDQFTMVLIALKLIKKSPEIRYSKNPMTLSVQGLMELRETLETH